MIFQGGGSHKRCDTLISLKQDPQMKNVSDKKVHFQTSSTNKKRLTTKTMKNESYNKNNISRHRRRNAVRQKTILQIRKDLYQRFYKFNLAQSFLKVFKMFQNSIGRHSPTYYESKYNFKQQWEFSNKNENKEQYRTNILYGCINLLILLALNFAVFGVSVKIFIEVENSQWMYYLVTVISLVQILKNWQHLLQISHRDKVLAIFKQAICIIISIILALFEKQVHFLSALGIVIVLLLYIKCCEIYQHIKIFHLSSKYREVVEIFDLFVLLLTISHIFAILLYATTILHPESNWMTHIRIEDEGWQTKYIYSLYFSCTTLLTVGYGDVSPTNVAEIMTILLTQLIGIATFAYAVNKIGAALTNITERAQKLQKDLGNVEHIGNEYRLKPEIVCRMRTELIKDKNFDSELNLSEENELFSKFSEDLRQRTSLVISIEIQVESSMRVIKRSMFMIGNWTGKLQSKIARKLVKEIYAIDQFLPQTQGKEKIYILDKGKIDVLNNAKSGFKVCFQKVLKNLSIVSNNEVVVENVYGYSFVISDRQIHLNAVAKSNSICYSLSKADLFELLAESEEDREHFHELKSKIDLSRIPEQIEAPSIINFREHYCPSVHYIIATNFYKNNHKNNRCLAIRKNRKIALKCYNETYPSATIISRKDKMQKSSHFRDEMSSGTRFNDAEEQKNFDVLREEEERNLLGEILGFEACKQYQRYYKKSNYDQVLRRLKLKICRTSLKYNPVLMKGQ